MQVVPPLLLPHLPVGLLLFLVLAAHEPERASASGRESAANANAAAAAATATEPEFPLGWRAHGRGRLLPMSR